MEVQIKLNHTEVDIDLGLTKASNLYGKAGVTYPSQCLYLNRQDDIDTPLLPDDYIVIHGGENIIADKINKEIGDNPQVRHPIKPRFNGGTLEPGFDQARVKAHELQAKDNEFQSSKLFVDLDSQADVCIAGDQTLVLQDNDSYFTIPVAEDNDDAIDVELCSRSDRTPPKGQQSYKIKIDGDKHKVEKQIITGQEIISTAGKSYDEWSLNQKLRGGRRKPIQSDEAIDLAQPGIERFETVRKQAQQG